MLRICGFSDEDVAKICLDPFKNLNTLVDDLKVQVNKGKGKNPTASVKVNFKSQYQINEKGEIIDHPKFQLTGCERTEFRKNGKVEEAKRSAAIGLLWKLLKEEKVKKSLES